MMAQGPRSGLMNSQGQSETLQANLIMPEPCEFISPDLGPCAIIRPTGPGQIDAAGAITGFISDGLFTGHPQFKEFTTLLLDLAAEADEARREFGTTGAAPILFGRSGRLAPRTE